MHKTTGQGARRIETDLQWDGRQWIARLLIDGQAVVDIMLDEWAQLGATKWAVNEALESRSAGTNRIGD